MKEAQNDIADYSQRLKNFLQHFIIDNPNIILSTSLIIYPLTDFELDQRSKHVRSDRPSFYVKDYKAPPQTASDWLLNGYIKGRGINHVYIIPCKKNKTFLSDTKTSLCKQAYSLHYCNFICPVCVLQDIIFYSAQAVEAIKDASATIKVLDVHKKTFYSQQILQLISRKKTLTPLHLHFRCVLLTISRCFRYIIYLFISLFMHLSIISENALTSRKS